MAEPETQFLNVMFQGKAISTTVTSSGDAVDNWLYEILDVHSRRLHRLVVGLNVPTSSPAALLQLCAGRHCLILQLLHADYLPDALAEFLAEPDYTFVGVGVGEDAKRLSDDWGLEVASTEDLAGLAADGMDRPDLRCAGLEAIASAVIGVGVGMPQWVRTSAWDASQLSHQQIKYACIEAFVSFEVGRVLLDPY